jgi:hypothetical protein
MIELAIGIAAWLGIGGLVFLAYMAIIHILDK